MRARADVHIAGICEEDREVDGVLAVYVMKPGDLFMVLDVEVFGSGVYNHAEWYVHICGIGCGWIRVVVTADFEEITA